MQQHIGPFGKRRAPIAEFKSIEEEYNSGQLSKRRERSLAIYLTPLVAFMLAAILTFSPESRALALEFGVKGFQLGSEWLLRGFID